MRAEDEAAQYSTTLKNRANAARALGISERTLRYRLASFREAGIAVGGTR